MTNPLTFLVKATLGNQSRVASLKHVVQFALQEFVQAWILIESKLVGYTTRTNSASPGQSRRCIQIVFHFTNRQRRYDWLVAVVGPGIMTLRPSSPGRYSCQAILE